MNIPDDLSHGPLDDGVARAEYMRACYRDYDEEWEYNTLDAFTPWLELIERLNRDRHDAVVVWTGENVSEATFLAMVCERLAGRPEQIVHVTVPGRHGRNYVVVHAPEELRAFLASWRALSDAERAGLAQERNFDDGITRYEIEHEHHDRLALRGRRQARRRQEGRRGTLARNQCRLRPDQGCSGYGVTARSAF